MKIFVYVNDVRNELEISDELYMEYFAYYYSDHHAPFMNLSSEELEKLEVKAGLELKDILQKEYSLEDGFVLESDRIWSEFRIY